jgi:hypothetical protein
MAGFCAACGKLIGAGAAFWPGCGAPQSPSEPVPSQGPADRGPNLELSRKRAEAVKTALMAQYHVGAQRLAASGRGASQPVETNGTMEAARGTAGSNFRGNRQRGYDQ